MHVLLLALVVGCGSKSPPIAPEAAPSGLPAWDDVPSDRPPGATDRPIAVLVVTPDHRCFKRWVSPMARPAPGAPRGDHVEETLLYPTPEVQCPEPRATDVLAAWQATR